ncbi:MAG TPA: putative C-S lyase, partial [Candidatus Cloacimonas sp.]|nr:putative C-S lyase [Candidatus Cloacimonas sp.]
LEELLCYLNGNREYISNFVQNELPGVLLSPIEGTFLAWLDFRNWGLPEPKLQEMIIKKAGLALEPGSEFGDKDEGFMRLNFGCPRSILELALSKIKLLAEDL